MNNLKKQFQGDLNEKDSIKLAGWLTHVGNNLNYGFDFSECYNVKSFTLFDKFNDDYEDSLEILKMAFDWTRDIEDEFKYYVNSVNSPQDFKSKYAKWRFEKNKPK